MNGIGTGTGLIPVTAATPDREIEELHFYVEGTPAPQGSKSPNRGGVGFHEASKKLPAWRQRLIEGAEAALAGREGFGPADPIYCGLAFYMPRGRTVKRTHPTVKPDVDKLERAVLDALTIAWVWGDDAQVVSGTRGKRYADECAPGVRITVRRAI